MQLELLLLVRGSVHSPLRSNVAPTSRGCGVGATFVTIDRCKD